MQREQSATFDDEKGAFPLRNREGAAERPRACLEVDKVREELTTKIEAEVDKVSERMKAQDEKLGRILAMLAPRESASRTPRAMSSRYRA